MFKKIGAFIQSEIFSYLAKNEGRKFFEQKLIEFFQVDQIVTEDRVGEELPFHLQYAYLFILKTYQITVFC